MLKYRSMGREVTGCKGGARSPAVADRFGKGGVARNERRRGDQSGDQRDVKALAYSGVIRARA